MYKDGFVMKIENQRYWIPYGTTQDKQLLTQYFKSDDMVKVVTHSLFGMFLQQPEHKRFRKLVNQIIRAKYNPENQGLKTIIVKLSDRSIKLKPCIVKH